MKEFNLEEYRDSMIEKNKIFQNTVKEIKNSLLKQESSIFEISENFSDEICRFFKMIKF